jgi:hypothetical protein
VPIQRIYARTCYQIYKKYTYACTYVYVVREWGVERDIDIRKLFTSKIRFKFLTVLQNNMLISQHLHVICKKFVSFGVSVKASEAPDINDRYSTIHSFKIIIG